MLSDAAQARKDCIDREADCRGCLHAIESMGWTCKVKETKQVVRALKGEKEAALLESPLGRPKKMTPEKVWAIMDALESGSTARALAKEYGVGASMISMMKSGAVWRLAVDAWRQARGKESA